MRLLSDIDTAIIHCSSTPDSTNRYIIGGGDSRNSIDEWHRLRGFMRSGGAMKKGYMDAGVHRHIGYHRVIHRDGTIHCGRSYHEIGAHAVGHNTSSVGWCLIGDGRFTLEQWDALRGLAVGDGMRNDWKIIGHYQVDKNGKTCPKFNVQAWLENDLVPNIKNIYHGKNS